MTEAQKTAIVKAHQALTDLAGAYAGNASMVSWANYRAADLLVQTNTDTREDGPWKKSS